jgi:hypothetical protein
MADIDHRRIDVRFVPGPDIPQSDLWQCWLTEETYRRVHPRRN